MVRVTTSRNTDSVKPTMLTPHSTMSTASSGSSAFHLRCRWRCRTSARGSTGARLLGLADELEDLHRVRAELGRELVLDGLGRLHEAGLVHAVDHLDTHLLELDRRLLLEGERLGRLRTPDLFGGGLGPLLLLIA